MRSFVIFVILLLAIGALAAPSLGYFPSGYNKECGIKIGVTEEAFGALIIGSETLNRYLECELERQGVMKDGHFLDEFKNNQKRLAETSEDRYEKINALAAVACTDSIKMDGLEAASDFAGCMRITSLLLQALQGESK